MQNLRENKIISRPKFDNTYGTRYGTLCENTWSGHNNHVTDLQRFDVAIEY